MTHTPKNTAQRPSGRQENPTKISKQTVEIFESHHRIELDGTQSKLDAVEQALRLDGFEPVVHGCPIDGNVALTDSAGVTYWWTGAHKKSVSTILAYCTAVIRFTAGTGEYLPMLHPDDHRLLTVIISYPPPYLPTRTDHFDVAVLEIAGRLIDRDGLRANTAKHWTQLERYLKPTLELAFEIGAQLKLTPRPHDVTGTVTANATHDDRIHVERFKDGAVPFVDCSLSQTALGVVATAMTQVAKTWGTSPLDTQIEFLPGHHAARVPA